MSFTGSIFPLLPSKVQKHTLTFMDMLTLRSLRYVSQEAALLVQEELTQSLHSLLSPFVTHPTQFLNVLQASGSVIAGDVAVAFMARELKIVPHTLLIYSPLDNPYPLQDFFDNQEGTVRVSRTLPNLRTATSWRARLIREEIKYQHHQTHTITLYESTSPIPLASVTSRSLASHLVTFVDRDSYGTAFPSLFFQHRSLLGPPLFSQTRDASASQPIDYMNAHHFKPDLKDKQQGGTVWKNYQLSLDYTLGLQQQLMSM